MKRCLTHAVIVVYLGALGWGVLAHAVSFAVGAHPVMYFLVWDMFCGWSSFSSRLQIIGEGESGTYYELAPGPWGEFQPFGNIGRRHYDVAGAHAPKLAMNALKHTRHEPITRIFVVEDCWPKKYNLPDELWAQIYDEPKDVHHYYQLRSVFTPDGLLLQQNSNWLSRQYSLSVGDNPRLQADARRSKPFFAFDYQNRPQGIYAPGAFYHPSASSRVGSRLGN